MLPGARKFQNLQGIGSDGDLPDVNVIEQAPRALTAPELTAQSDTDETAEDTPAARKIEKR